MAWFRVDDGFGDHDKARLAGLLGRALWGYVGPKCAQIKSDGVVAAHRVEEWVFLAGVRSKKERGLTAVQLLVASGLWHDHETISDCARCKKITGGLPEGAFYFHDWVDYQPTRDDLATPETKRIAKRKKALHRDDALRDEVWTRDRGRCRYCGITCDPNPNNRRGKDGLTYDHLDPGCFEPHGGNFPAGLVVACRACNSAKKSRTVDEWVAAGGRPLLPAPADTPAQGEVSPTDTAGVDLVAELDHDIDPPTDGSRPGSDPGQNQSDPIQVPRGDGSGPIGSGSGRDPGRTRVRSGGSGRGRSRSRGGAEAPPHPEARPP